LGYYSSFSNYDYEPNLLPLFFAGRGKFSHQCHSGLDPESLLITLDPESEFRMNFYGSK